MRSFGFHFLFFSSFIVILWSVLVAELVDVRVLLVVLCHVRIGAHLRELRAARAASLRR